MKLTTKINLILAIAFIVVLPLLLAVVAYTLPAPLAQDTLIGFVMSMAAIFIILLLVINIAIRKLVLKPIMRVTHQVEQVGKGNLRDPEIKVTGNDEIAEMLHAFNRMRRSVIKIVQMMKRMQAEARSKTGA